MIQQTGTLDVQKIRLDFPILTREVNGKPLVYLDNAATSQKPRQVIQALVDYYENHNANIHRGIHVLSEEATSAYEGARAKVARFIDARPTESIVFTRNATESINLVARSWGARNLRPGDEVLLSEAEHHSNLVPWQMIALETGARLRFVPILDDGTLDIDAAARLMGPRTKMVAITQMSNVLGTINPISQLADLAHGVGALILVDGAQSVPHLPVSVAELKCDFLAFSSHKMLGPTGIGVLYGRPELLEEMDPYMGGGSMIRTVELERSTWGEVPQKFEAGTPNIADTIAFGAAIDYLSDLGMENVRAHEIELAGYAMKALGQLPGLRIFGPLDPKQRGAVISFYYGNIHPHDIGTVVDQEGVAIRAGHHCCQPLMKRLGVPATARASFYIYNTTDEADVLVRALEKANKLFGGVSFR
jgi:cysteine desulfurase/selenocysteine lyase